MEAFIQILPIPALKDNYIWAIVNTQQKKALIVDPGEAKPVVDFLIQQALTLEGILITHHHWDHTNGVLELQKAYDVPVIGPASNQISNITMPVKEGDQIEIANFPLFTVMDIPGHTLDHLAYYTKDALFCGDTLFAAGCGRLFEGTAEEMYHSLMKLAGLPKTTKIYCAHEYTLKNLQFAETVEPQNSFIPQRMAAIKQLRDQHKPSLPSTLEEELKTNPFLRCKESDVRAFAEKQINDRGKNEIDIFRALRKAKDIF